MLIMYLGWKVLKGTKIVGYDEMDLETDVYVVGEEDLREMEQEKTARGKVQKVLRWIF